MERVDRLTRMLIWKLLRRLIPFAIALAIATVIILTFARTVGAWMMDRAESGASGTSSGRILTLDGQDIHLVDRGAGPVVVLLHGVPGWSGDWPEQLVARLATSHRVLAIDLFGFGFSSRPVDVGMRAWGEQVSRVLATLGVASAVVVGHDAGAAAALASAVANDSVVDRLVLLAPAVPIEDGTRSWRSFLPLVPGAGEVMAGWSSTLLRPAGMPAAVATGPWWDIPGTRRCTLTALRDGIPPDMLTLAIKDVRAPTLVLHGTADDVVPWSAAQRWVPSISGVLVRLVEGGGHWLPTERPDEVADAILNFMEDV